MEGWPAALSQGGAGDEGTAAMGWLQRILAASPGVQVVRTRGGGREGGLPAWTKAGGEPWTCTQKGALPPGSHGASVHT